MKLVDWLTIAGLVVGPVSAVLITLMVDGFRQARMRKEMAARSLMTGRLNVSDPAFLMAINTIPVDFADDEAVIAKWEAYIAETNKGAANPAAPSRWGDALNDLAQAVLRSIGYSERQAASIVRGAYVSTGYVDRTNLQTKALQAVVAVADNTGRMASANEKLIDRLADRGDLLPDEE